MSRRRKEATAHDLPRGAPLTAAVDAPPGRGDRGDPCNGDTAE
jgi:hypothetical protein